MALDVQKTLKNHDERLNTIESDVKSLKESLAEGLKKIDRSNDFIQNQTTEILKQVLLANGITEKHNYELEKIKTTNKSKMFNMIFGASGLVVIILDIIMKALGK